jgi:hypothetical protein
MVRRRLSSLQSPDIGKGFVVGVPQAIHPAAAGAAIEATRAAACGFMLIN